MTDLFSMSWPPAYTIKKHARARHVKLAIKNGLEITVPHRFNLKEIPGILEQHKHWIEKQLQQLQLHLKQCDILPSEMTLHALSQTWRIHYTASNHPLQIMMRPHNELVIFGKLENKMACRKILQCFVKAYARKFLLLQLQSISEKINLPYQKATIRNQHTRWGSCTKDKTISLNYKLIFLPVNLMTHVIIHELCHTVHLNHSSQFWKLVAQYDPHWQAHRRLLRKANEFIPAWL